MRGLQVDLRGGLRATPHSHFVYESSQIKSELENNARVGVILFDKLITRRLG